MFPHRVSDVEFFIMLENKKQRNKPFRNHVWPEDQPIAWAVVIKSACLHDLIAVLLAAVPDCLKQAEGLTYKAAVRSDSNGGFFCIVRQISVSF